MGTDSIDLEAARERDIVVSNIPGRTAPVVAEHAFALMLAGAKRVAYQTIQLRSGCWNPVHNVYLRGKTVGVVGTGTIGAVMIDICKVFGMRVVAWSFHPSPERGQKLGVEFLKLNELLQVSDVVTLHVKLTSDSYHLIGARELELMKSGSLLVNTARGPVVDTSALVAALQSGHLGGAALDVFDTEPLGSNDPLLACEHLVMTPHSADQTPEGYDLLNEGVVDNVIAFLQGHPQNVVT